MTNNKLRNLLGIVLLLIIAGGVFWYFKNHPVSSLTKNQAITSTEFDGNIKEVNGSSITVDGSFLSVDHPDVVKDAKTITVNVDSNTKITKVVVHLPTPDQLKQTHGAFNGRDLKRDTSSVDLSALQTDFKNAQYGTSIFVSAADNIYGKNSFTASKIKYEIAQ